MLAPVTYNLSIAILASLVLAMFVMVFMPAMSPAPHAQEAQADGQTAFVETGCARCHSVPAAELEATVAERMRGPDLGTAETDPDHDAAWIVAVVEQATELDNGPHRARFRGTDGQLRALAEWLVGLN